MLVEAVVGVVAGLLVLWLVLLLVLWRSRPDELSAGEMLRLLPDVVRLVARLSRDPTVPRGVRILLVALLAYLLSPIDVVPDFIPVLGYADDAIITALVLRWVVRRASPDVVARHWPGTGQGLRAVERLAGLTANPANWPRKRDTGGEPPVE